MHVYNGACTVYLTSQQMLETLSECFVRYGKPKYLHSDNGIEFKSYILQECCVQLRLNWSISTRNSHPSHQPLNNRPPVPETITPALSQDLTVSRQSI